MLQLFMALVFFFQAEDGIRDLVRSRGLGDVYKRQVPHPSVSAPVRGQGTRSAAGRRTLGNAALSDDPINSYALFQGHMIAHARVTRRPARLGAWPRLLVLATLLLCQAGGADLERMLSLLHI